MTAYNLGKQEAVANLDARRQNRRTKKLKCKPNYVQRGAACQKKKSPKRSIGVTAGLAVAGAVGASVLAKKNKNRLERPTSINKTPLNKQTLGAITFGSLGIIGSGSILAPKVKEKIEVEIAKRQAKNTSTPDTISFKNGEREELDEVEFYGVNNNFKYKTSSGEYFFKESNFASATREKVVSKLANNFGLQDNFLPVSLEKLDGKDYIATPFIKNQTLESVEEIDIWNNDIVSYPLEEYANRDTIKQLYLFDYVINHNDRSSRNVMLGENNTLISIDNGLALYSVANPKQTSRFISSNNNNRGRANIPNHRQGMSLFTENVYQAYIKQHDLSFSDSDIQVFLNNAQQGASLIKQAAGGNKQLREDMLEVYNWRINRLKSLNKKKYFKVNDLFDTTNLDSLEQERIKTMEFLQNRLDARRSKKKEQFECTPGKSIPCKGICIPKSHTCRDKVKLTATEKRQIGEIIDRAQDKYANRTIRDLQQEARERGVYRSNHLKKSQLTSVLKQLDKDPVSQENLRKTLEKRRKTREIATKAAPKELQKTWKAINTVSKAYKQNPDQAGLIIAAGLMGVSAGIAGRIRDRHRDGLTESAEIALNRAKTVPIDRTNKPDILFAVGGFGSTGSRGERMRDLLNEPLDNTRGEKWLGKNHHIVPFNSKDFDINISSSKRDADGNYNPVYLGEVATKGFGKFLTNFRRSRNDAAVDLAARMYAYGQRYPKKRLNVLAHGVGGNVTDEAVEILSRMGKTKRSDRKAEEIIQNVNVARLGSSYFGMMNSKMWRKGVNHRTIAGGKDPFSIMPKRAAKWIGSLTGGEVEDYLKNVDVREQLKETFGYYTSSLSGAAVTSKRKAERRKAIGEALSTVSPGAGKLWTQIGKIQDKARDNPTAAAALSFAVVTGGSVAAYSRAKRKYNQGLNHAGFEATKAAEKIKLGNTNNRSNITIAVGGTGTSAQEIVDNLPQEIQNKTYTVNAQDYGINSADVPSNLKPGTKAYAAWLATNGFGSQLNKIARSQFQGNAIDPEAVQLAALMYRHGGKIYGANRKKGVKNPNNYKINLLASGDGSIKARQAMEILEKMGPRGQSIAKQVKLASFGSPDFGLVNSDPGSASRPKYVSHETSYIGEKDFFGMFPSRRSAAVIRPQGVGHNIKDYLQNKEVTKNLLENFYK